MSVCNTFRELSFRTWTHLGRARHIEHQLGEETLTDLNVLELKARHPDEIFTKTFTKPQEGVNGADWEWWFTDPRMKQWLGFRVQAKVLNLASERFEHLHYRKGKTYQSAKLKRKASEEGLIPLYCIYSHWADGFDVPGWPCGTFGPVIESFGCALLSAKHVDALRKQSHESSLGAVVEKSVPWHCLVCCAGYGGSNLPERAWEYSQAVFGVKPSKRRPANAPAIGLRDHPPKYVRMVVEAGQMAEIDESDPGLRGIVVLRQKER